MGINNLMEPNIGRADRYIRLTLGSWLLASGAARMARDPDWTACGIGLLGGILLAEGILGVCVGYHLTGVNTREDAGHAGIDIINSPGEGI